MLQTAVVLQTPKYSSASTSPQTQIDSVTNDITNTINNLELFNPNSPQQTNNELINPPNTKNLTVPPPNHHNNNTNNNANNDDPHDESLHEMVQSILNDSDNDVVLNNLNELGYNNIQYNRHSPINNSDSPSPQPQPQIDNKNNEQLKSQSSPSLHSITLNKDNHPVAPITPTKRKYVIEWRTVIFIRHGKSKWNAAEGNTIGKVVAAGQGLWEYYKNKKLRDKNITRQKSDVDIMDASLSREGIMEALQLCTYLRQYTTNKQLNGYNDLFEQTRHKIHDILHLSNNDHEQNTQHKLQECLQMLDQYKIASLIAAHPPQDDDNLRLPQPIPQITCTPPHTSNTFTTLKSSKSVSINANEYETNQAMHKLDDIHENNTLQDDINHIIESNQATTITTTNISDTNSPPSTSYASLQDLQEQNNTNKGSKKYMAQIVDPTHGLPGQYIIKILNGDEEKCGIVVSNLRRAMSTACICLKDRLQRRPYEKIQILGCLQEIGLNSDTRPLLFTKDHKPNLAKTEKTSPLLKHHNMKELYAYRLSTKYYKGDASDKTAQQRLQEFALWLFAQRKYLHVVAIGHSHWFKSFFKAYLSENISEEQLPARVRTNKIRNCGVVAFRMMKKYVASKSKRHGRHISFEIAAGSITTLQFSLYSVPVTNHEQKENGELVEEESDESEEEIAEGIGDVGGDVEVKEMVLSQSVCVGDGIPGILASIQDGSNECDALLIYKDEGDDVLGGGKAPTILSENTNELKDKDKDKDKDKEELKEEKKEGKRKKSNGFGIGVSLTKPKNWMSRAIGRFGGGGGKSDNEEEDKIKKENNVVVNDVNDVNDDDNKETNETNEKDNMTNVNQLGWDLTNLVNDTQIITDDEDYIQ